MSLDILITLLQVMVTIFMAGVGIEMANNPPVKVASKNKYRLAFALSGVVLCGITLWQSKRTSAQQEAAQAASVEAAQKNENDLNSLRDQLKGLGSILVGMSADLEKTQRSRVGKPDAKINRCDVNRDGRVDAADVQTVVNQILGKIPRTAAGDVNSDGLLNVADLSSVINATLRSGTCAY